jgi:hypothetical protein
LRRQAPVGLAAQPRGGVHRRYKCLGVAQVAGQRGVAAVAARTADITAVGAAEAVVPTVGMAGVAQVGDGGGFDFSGQAGDVVLGAGPVGGRGAQGGAGSERGVVVGDLGLVEALGAGAGFGQRAPAAAAGSRP